jgi:hypothetical protein
MLHLLHLFFMLTCRWLNVDAIIEMQDVAPLWALSEVKQVDLDQRTQYIGD